MPAGIRGGDLRRSRLARHFLGNSGTAAIRTSFRLSRSGRETVGPRPDLSRLRKPRGDRPSGYRTGDSLTLAARSRWYAALSRRGEVVFRACAPATHRTGPTLRVAARYGGAGCAGDGSELG